jgi:oleate hydratase
VSESQILTIEGLAIEPEVMLGSTRISDQFEPDFFNTDFWLMWCTTFAFQPWHSAVEFKRYLVRFAHMVSGFNRLQGIMRTAYNQYDSLVQPLRKWLDERGVVFEMNTTVTNLLMVDKAGVKTVDQIVFERGGRSGRIAVRPVDRVFVTLGSMTEGSSLGSMDTAPLVKSKAAGGAWRLWETIAAGRPEFGKPCVFSDHIDQSKWVSFTTTMRDRTLLRIVRDLTGNVPGEGGLITFPQSSWLASIVIPHQPHFIGQPDDVSVLWGYGLFVDKSGDFIKKPMSACSGREIMTEVLGHLGAQSEAENILKSAICIPCMMPFITSQFMPRAKGDRPDVIPKGAKNFAFIGQYCELPEDVVFTVEYSIRSAQTAVYELLNLKRKPPPVYHGKFDPSVLYRAFRALHDQQA